MHKYIIKRILMLIPILLGVSFIVFSIMQFTPGNPGRTILGAHAPREEVEKLNEELGLNDPFIVRYVTYISGAVRGDFGYSYRTGRPVIDDIARRFPISITLASISIGISLFFGIIIGLISAVKQYSLIDSISVISAMFMSALPEFWLGLMLIVFFVLNLGWFPSSGIGTIKHYVLPSLTLSVLTLGLIIRMMRSTMLEVVRQDYIRTARAKGASEYRVIFKHALKNALIPVITVAGVYFGALLGGTVIVEIVFGIPGVGTHLMNAIRMKDLPVVLASVILIAAAFSLANLIVDLFYAMIDPRIKSQYMK